MIYINRVFLRSLKGYENEYWANLPVVRQLLTESGVEFTTPVTFLVGENDIGKSTLVEAIAVNYGFNPGIEGLPTHISKYKQNNGERNLFWCSNYLYVCIAQIIKMYMINETLSDCFIFATAVG